MTLNNSTADNNVAENNTADNNAATENIAEKETEKSYMVQLESEKEYEDYDITGDNVNDTVYIDADISDDMYQNIILNVNGTDYIVEGDGTFYSYTVNLVSLGENGKFIWIKASSDNDYDPFEALYQFDGESLKTVLNLNKYILPYAGHTGSEITSVSDNEIEVKQTLMSSFLARIDVNYTFKYEDGEFVLADNISEITDAQYLYEDKEYGTLKNELTLYKEAKSSDVTGTLDKGTKAKATRIYIDDEEVYVELTTEDNTSGWVKCDNAFDESQLIFEECQYAG
jgi:hypothetical protein